MPPALTDYTYAFGDTGQILNTDSMGLPFLDVTKVSGLDTAPLRTTTDEHQGMDGTYIDTPFLSARTVVVEATLYTDPTQPETFLDQLRSDYNSNTVRPFYFQHPGQGLRFVNGQGGGCAYDVDASRRTGTQDVQLMVLAGDPYIYSYPASTGSVTVPTVITVGVGFNISFNVSFGGSSPSASANVFNSGTHTAYPVITITGACVNPVLTDGYGITMQFAITLAATDQLVIDCRNKSVVLNGTVSRRSTLQGLKWFSVPAGMPETIFFGAASGTATAFVTTNGTFF